MKRLRNNKGLTLVELIVSIAILAIIVLPLLTSFVQATKTNVKAKNKLHATEVAQNIMEGLENVSLNDIALQFNYPSYGAGFDLFDKGSASVIELKPSGSNYTKVEGEGADLNRTVVVADESSKPVFNQSSDHKYYFWAEGISVTNSTKKYNALITLDAKTDVNSTKNKEYNNTPISDLKSVDNTNDAISANADTPDMIINLIQLQYGLTGLSQSDVSRTITVDIKKEAATGRTTVTVKYKYFVKSKNITFPESGSLYETDYTSVVYDNSSHIEDTLKAVYLFYYPWYTSTRSFPLNTDSIVINNPDMVDCNVCIIKQTRSDASTVYGEEANYKCSVTLNELSNNGANPKAHASINTNIGTNMAVEDMSSAAYIVYNQVTYIYNNANANQTLVKQIIDINSITTQEKSDRLFDVSVSVYPSNVEPGAVGSNTPIVTFTGGMTD